MTRSTITTSLQSQTPAQRTAATNGEKNFLFRVIRQATFLLAAFLCLTPFLSPPFALALGTCLGLVNVNPFISATKYTARWLLQGCVVALGFGMDLATVMEAGKNGFLFAAGGILLTLSLGTFVGRRLNLSDRTSALISSGTAICGGSAVAAVGSVIGALEGEITVAMGTTFLLNAVALSVFPIIGSALHLSQTQFGTWAGVAIHDISSVVGAASHYGPTALETATAVKLSRALWIMPVALGAAFTFRTPHLHQVTGDTIGFDPNQASPATSGKLHIPYFIGWFLLASLARSFVPGIAAIGPTISHLAALGLTLTLFLIGAGISTRTLRAVGWQPLLQGLILWLVVSAGSLLVILVTIH